MADFNLTAQLILRGPKNISSIRNQIHNQLQNVRAKLTVSLDPKLRSNLQTINRPLVRFDETLKRITSDAKAASQSISALAASSSPKNSA